MVPGGLPEVCWVTGKPSTDWMHFSFLTIPAWMRVLVIPAFILRLLVFYRLLARLAGTHAAGRLPVTRAWWCTFMTIRWGSRGLFWIALTLLAFGLLGGGRAAELSLGWVPAALFASALLAWVAWPAVRPRALVRREGNRRWIELKNCHPRFGEAVRRRYSVRSGPLVE